MGVAVPGGFRRCRCLTPRHGSVSSRRSSNRTCGFPASGSRTRSCLRPRKARRSRCKARETVVGPQSLVREAHRLPGPHLVLATEPLAQPPRGVPVDGAIRRADLPKGEVVRPTGQHPVETPYHLLRRQQPVSRRGQLAHATADALDTGRARARADVGGARGPAGNCAQSGSRGNVIGSSGNRQQRVFSAFIGNFSRFISPSTAASISDAGARPSTAKSSA